MFNGVSIGPLDVMAFHDLIMDKQCHALANADLLISFSVNMMGPVKVNRAANIIFVQGLNAIQQYCIDTPFSVISRQITTHKAGLHLLVAVKGITAKSLKTQLISLEQSLPLGRLMDIDVIDSSGRPVSRRAIGYSARQCLICEHSAKDCGRNKRHSLAQLQAAIEEKLTQ
ncbi:citrate lyase holo-[acyl-carrier protein] synthase [Shewanella marina]|uniref:citrate lyase holo-[acyl-carrier protein] synthase n=1 Tax=Shewanella marina TaxID=487319 RepID=UPI00046F8AC7|nr:citrate lyase holo-[acyl-carrier protein] synthase [Shewanella marina]